MQALDGITYADVLEWQQSAFRDVFIDMMVHGNFSVDGIKEWTPAVAEALGGACVCLRILA